ncbi:MAG: S-methyl-5-thioribose-1-phosphate isomerase [Clostridiales bacterium]|nr:S-methyl-5-thioribose-1-phosphate isomerase [Clostridiales bacterium]
MVNIHEYDTVALDHSDDSLTIIDQTLLPNELKILRLKTLEDIWEAIKTLRVRGAPAIGAAAACGIYLRAKEISTEHYDTFHSQFTEAKEYLASARPTAVNLTWALDRMEQRLLLCGKIDRKSILESLKSEAEAIISEDIETCKKIGEYALTLTQKGWGLLTHCNAGKLATIRYGTATAPIYLGQERGYNFKVYADETRPLLQGARLTAYELMSAGVDVTLICDNMAATVMKNGWIQAVFTGCDRVSMNGDAANKIGTLGVAILAKRYNIPFYICAPTSSIDRKAKTGADIVIEQRSPDEVTSMWYVEPMSAKGVKVYNPAFDVTDHDLITAIITEKGIAYPAFNKSLADIMK